MKITDAKIDSGSLTGKSGINLDECGFTQDNINLTCWVIDGVSPLIFRKKDAWQFRKFFHAGQLLNRAFKQVDWRDIKQDFLTISNQFRTNKNANYFLSGPFYHWPLFSCGLVKINQEKEQIECVLYGDCVIIIRRGGFFEKFEYQELENKKYTINKLFKFFDAHLRASKSGCLKKLLFAIIRIQQIWFGKLRIFSIKKYFSPPIVKLSDKKDIEHIVILSDGVSWYIKDNDEHMQKLMNSLSELGVQKTLSWLRNMEDMNTDFGRHDDSTIISISL